ncbi:MAG: Asp-tRNA(Asn)/Glu-tRNA(Gln) amidotransferase subunit GatA [Alphaproteobacteria bacterium]|nr:Asp-tRNA(Asn)/Glu-tRNA(Gln) amidotransferase subunit GatA [Alphaproteobacteria bacterium]
MAFASSFDQAGPMTRTVRDAALMLEVMAGHDPKESTSADIPVPSYEKMLTGNVKGMKVGIPTEYKSDGLDGSMKQYWEKSAQWLRDAGAEVVDISLPHTKYALPTYYVLATAEASSNLARYDGVRYGFRSPGTSLDEMYENTRGEGFGDEVKRRIMLGTFVLSSGYYDAYYIKGQKVRALIAQDFRKAFEKVDLILTPTTPTPAFSVEGAPQDPLTMYLNDVYTVTANLAGVPAISVPAGLSSDGLPLGLQLFAPAFEEGRMLQAAEVIEQAAAFPKLQDIQIAA